MFISIELLAKLYICILSFEDLFAEEENISNAIMAIRYGKIPNIEPKKLLFKLASYEYKTKKLYSCISYLLDKNIIMFMSLSPYVDKFHEIRNSCVHSVCTFPLDIDKTLRIAWILYELLCEKEIEPFASSMNIFSDREKESLKKLSM